MNLVEGSHWSLRSSCRSFAWSEYRPPHCCGHERATSKGSGSNTLNWFSEGILLIAPFFPWRCETDRGQAFAIEPGGGRAHDRS